ncbi:collagenase [Kitasatospora sp. P5_F3]
MSRPRGARRALLTVALAASLALPLTTLPAAAATGTADPVPAVSAAPVAGPDDHVDHAATADGGGQPGPELTVQQAGSAVAAAPGCTPEAFSAFTPARLADFLADPAVQYGDCLAPLLRSWNPRYAPVFAPAHVQAVADRITSIAPGLDGTDRNQQQLWYYLHVAVLYDFEHVEVTLDAPTLAAVQRAITAYTANQRVFEPNTKNGDALGEVLCAASHPGLRTAQTGLAKRVLRLFAQPGPYVGNAGWNWAGQNAQQLNFQGVGNRLEDPAGTFLAAVSADSDYRAAFADFAGYRHLRGTSSEYLIANSMLEYGRFAQIPALRPQLTAPMTALFEQVTRDYGRFTPAWSGLVWGVYNLDLCSRYAVCPDDIRRVLFPQTYSYDNGALVVRTSLDRAAVDQLYYATKQVKAQYFRLLGTDAPLAEDVNSTLTVQLFGTKPDYRAFQGYLHGISDVENGGMYIENGATFYTYQRTTSESYLSLEELFRHEYTHYLNGRWAIHGGYDGPRWSADEVFPIEEGTAEFFAGSTRADGVRARTNMVNPVKADDDNRVPRMTVDQIVHATRATGFRTYPYAATFFGYLAERHPERFTELYRLLRADDLAGVRAWKDRIGTDQGVQAEYDAYLTRQITELRSLFVPATSYTPNGSLAYAWAAEAQAGFTAATQNPPVCKDNGDWNNKMRFSCQGRITANLTAPADQGQVFKDMAETVDTYLLDRSAPVANNLADTNCWFGPVEIWPGGRAGTSAYTCEGPLRR